MMKASPILFSAPMIKALLAGVKTQTRRTIKPQPECGFIVGAPGSPACPYGSPGDLLWARETWAQEDHEHEDFDPDTGDVLSTENYRWTHYRATPHKGFRVLPDRVPVTHLHESQPDCACVIKTWRPSIFMPRWASRITLRITDVRVQRLQQISEADAQAEGVDEPGLSERSRERFRKMKPWPELYRPMYSLLWDEINGAGSWDANPWVWALTFEVLQKNVDEVLANG